MSGLTGYVSFAHGALAGIGGYAVVIALNADWGMVPALLAAVAAAVVASLVIGATASACAAPPSPSRRCSSRR